MTREDVKEMEHDEQAVAVEATAREFYDEWAEIVRVMTLAEGEDWERGLSMTLQIKQAEGAGGATLQLFSFPDGRMYTIEPTTGRVIETSQVGHEMTVRQFDRYGELIAEGTQPLGDPNMN